VTATLLGMAAVAVAAAALGLATGWWQVLPVLSPSMRPAFDAGAAVLAVRVPAGSVRAGDVIVYRAPIQDRRLVVHRVVRVVRAGERPVVQTGGDANDAPDPWLARLPDGAVWKVGAEVPHLGHALLLLRRPPVRSAMLLAGVGVALAWALRAVWSAPAHPVGWGGGAAGRTGGARGRLAGDRRRRCRHGLHRRHRGVRHHLPLRGAGDQEPVAQRRLGAGLRHHPERALRGVEPVRLAP
jgi:signal peptidase I